MIRCVAGDLQGGCTDLTILFDIKFFRLWDRAGLPGSLKLSIMQLQVDI